MPWVLDSLTIGWPPHVKLKRAPGDEEALHPLFLFLRDKTLLRSGYGTQAGIVTPGDLADRIDAIRDKLFVALAALPPKAPTEWLTKLEDAAHELLGKANEVRFERGRTAPEPAEIAPAVNQLRAAVADAAEHVFAVYQLPAARDVADRIRRDIQ